MSAESILQEGLKTLSDRAADRDKPDGERSMRRCVAMFNAGSGHELSERDGDFFMVCLKMVRAWTTPTGKRDDYVDGSNYFALAGESVEAES